MTTSRNVSRPFPQYRIAKIHVAVVIVAVLFCFSSRLLAAAVPTTPGSLSITSNSLLTDTSQEDTGAPQNGLSIDVSSQQLLVFGTARGVKLFQSTAIEPQNIPAASKLMTAVIALENLSGDTLITISNEAESADLSSAVPIGLKKGSKYPVTFLVASVLYRNSDAAALSLAEYIDNSEADFVERMNDTAKKLSMKNTFFVNTSGKSTLTGVPSEVPNSSGLRQYTTIDDLSVLFRYALNITEFRDVFTDYKMIQFPDSGKPMSLSSLVVSAWAIENVEGAVLFPATGSESSDSACVLGLASTENFEIAIIMSGFADNMLYRDLNAVVDSIFNFYEVSKLVESGDAYKSVEIEGMAEPIPSAFKNTVLYIHPAGKEYIIPESIFTPSNVLTLPIKKGDVLGQVEITLEDGTSLVTEIMAVESIEVNESLLARATKTMENNRNITILIIACFVCLVLFTFYVILRRITMYFRKTKTSRF